MTDSNFSIDDIFSETGPLAGRFTEYSPRPGQISMAEDIFSHLDNEEHCIVEAGTGLGKSLAYLIPLLIHCVEEGKRCAVSTETKTLQNQLIQKEIPLVQEVIKDITGADISCNLCLGSGNYVCIRRYEQAMAAESDDSRNFRKLQKISSLINNEKIFSRFDIHINPELWNRINRDSDFCLHSRCHNFSICPFQRAKRSWQNSTLLVINHYLFFTHINTGRTYLPYIDCIVFDEAHSIGDICKKQLGFEYDSHFLKRFVPREDTLPVIQRISNDSKKNQLNNTLLSIYSEYGNLFKLLDRMTADENSRLLPFPVTSISLLTSRIRQFLKNADALEEDEAEDSVHFYLDGIKAKLLSLYNGLQHISGERDPGWIFWVENASATRLLGQPLDPAPLFQNEIIPYFSTIAAVSATLTVEHDFGYFTELTGFQSFARHMYGSDFNYASQVLLYLPGIQASVRDGEYIQECVKEIINITHDVEGNILILFNSYSMLQECHAHLEKRVENTIISQDEYSPVEAVEMYLQEENPILLGTHSFWQGIDLPGNLLKAVIITRLPFPPPARPDIQAASERLREQGLDPFSSLFLPSAVIKFRQGFGRLMRSNEDWGIVAVLDDRIQKKNYGKIFLSSIPECIIADSSKVLHDFCKKFM